MQNTVLLFECKDYDINNYLRTHEIGRHKKKHVNILVLVASEILLLGYWYCIPS